MKALITGGTRGIGAAVRRELNSLGADIFILDIEEPAQPYARWINADMTDPRSVARKLVGLHEPFDAVINCAGLPPLPGKQKEILTVNYQGLVAAAEAILPNLPSGCSIVNISSKAGSRWRENIAQVREFLKISGPGQLDKFIALHKIDEVRAYDLSKEAVIWWSICQVERLIPQKIRINCVSPAAVSTRILADFESAFGERAAKMIARIGRPGTADEVARVVRFLASPESHWINGVDLPVDGGTSALVECDRFGPKPDRQLYAC